MDLLKLNGYCDTAQEDYETFETVFCEEISIQFLFEFNKLRNISFSPLFDNNDEIVWPKKRMENNHIWSAFESFQCGANTMLSGKAAGDNKSMEIKIGIGLNDIVFGIFQEDVINLLRKPDKISETEKDDGIVY